MFPVSPHNVPVDAPIVARWSIPGLETEQQATAIFVPAIVSNLCIYIVFSVGHPTAETCGQCLGESALFSALINRRLLILANTDGVYPYSNTGTPVRPGVITCKALSFFHTKSLILFIGRWRAVITRPSYSIVFGDRSASRDY